MLADAQEPFPHPLNQAVALASQRVEQASMLVAASAISLFLLGLLAPALIGSVPMQTKQTLSAMLLVAGPVSLTLGIIAIYLRDVGSVPGSRRRENTIFGAALAACGVSMIAFFALTQSVWITGFF